MSNELDRKAKEFARDSFAEFRLAYPDRFGDADSELSQNLRSTLEQQFKLNEAEKALKKFEEGLTEPNATELAEAVATAKGLISDLNAEIARIQAEMVGIGEPSHAAVSGLVSQVGDLQALIANAKNMSPGDFKAAVERIALAVDAAKSQALQEASADAVDAKVDVYNEKAYQDFQETVEKYGFQSEEVRDQLVAQISREVQGDPRAQNRTPQQLERDVRTGVEVVQTDPSLDIERGADGSNLGPRARFVIAKEAGKEIALSERFAKLREMWQGLSPEEKGQLAEARKQYRELFKDVQGYLAGQNTPEARALAEQLRTLDRLGGSEFLINSDALLGVMRKIEQGGQGITGAHVTAITEQTRIGFEKLWPGYMEGVYNSYQKAMAEGKVDEANRILSDHGIEARGPQGLAQLEALRSLTGDAAYERAKGFKGQHHCGVGTHVARTLTGAEALSLSQTMSRMLNLQQQLAVAESMGNEKAVARLTAERAELGFDEFVGLSRDIELMTSTTRKGEMGASLRDRYDAFQRFAINSGHGDVVAKLDDPAHAFVKQRVLSTLEELAATTNKARRDELFQQLEGIASTDPSEYMDFPQPPNKDGLTPLQWQHRENEKKLSDGHKYSMVVDFDVTKLDPSVQDAVKRYMDRTGGIIDPALHKLLQDNQTGYLDANEFVQAIDKRITERPTELSEVRFGANVRPLMLYITNATNENGEIDKAKIDGMLEKVGLSHFDYDNARTLLAYSPTVVTEERYKELKAEAAALTSKGETVPDNIKAQIVVYDIAHADFAKAAVTPDEYRTLAGRAAVLEAKGDEIPVEIRSKMAVYELAQTKEATTLFHSVLPALAEDNQRGGLIVKEVAGITAEYAMSATLSKEVTDLSSGQVGAMGKARLQVLVDKGLIDKSNTFALTFMGRFLDKATPEQVTEYFTGVVKAHESQQAGLETLAQADSLRGDPTAVGEKIREYQAQKVATILTLKSTYTAFSEVGGFSGESEFSQLVAATEGYDTHLENASMHVAGALAWAGDWVDWAGDRTGLREYTDWAKDGIKETGVEEGLVFGGTRVVGAVIGHENAAVAAKTVTIAGQGISYGYEVASTYVDKKLDQAGATIASGYNTATTYVDKKLDDAGAALASWRDGVSSAVTAWWKGDDEAAQTKVAVAPSIGGDILKSAQGLSPEERAKLPDGKAKEMLTRVQEAERALVALQEAGGRGRGYLSRVKAAKSRIETAKLEFATLPQAELTGLQTEIAAIEKDKQTRLASEETKPVVTVSGNNLVQGADNVEALIAGLKDGSIKPDDARVVALKTAIGAAEFEARMSNMVVANEPQERKDDPLKLAASVGDQLKASGVVSNEPANDEQKVTVADASTQAKQAGVAGGTEHKGPDGDAAKATAAAKPEEKQQAAIV